MDVRFAVNENALSNRALVTEADNADHLTRRGKGWVGGTAGEIAGFAIVSIGVSAGGTRPNGEIRFELTADKCQRLRSLADAEG